MSVTQISSQVVPVGAKAYGLTIAEPATQWWSAAITAGVSKAWGSWVQLVAATTEDLLIWLVVVVPPVFSSGEWSAVGIGTGAAASEVEVLSLPMKAQAYNQLDFTYALPVPILVPSGTRIAARMTIESASSGAGYVALGHIKASVVSSF